MKSKSKILILLIIIAVSSVSALNAQNALNPQEKKEGWQLLFNGKNFNGWRGVNKKNFPEKGWVIEDGAIVSNGTNVAESADGGDIITKKEYENFILKVQWKMETKGGNSGIKYFVKEGFGENSKYGFGLEYQILDDQNFSWMLTGKMKPNDFYTLGALYEMYPPSPEKQPNPLGQWNESIIVSRGNHVEHWLNEKKMLEYERGSADFKERVAKSKFKDIKDFGLFPKGHILLQDHGSIVYFKNIKIKELK